MTGNCDTTTQPPSDQADAIDMPPPKGQLSPEAEQPSTSAVDQLMAIPHIVAAVLHHARRDRASLARLMQTNRNFYILAGPALYHTAAVAEDTMDAFFEGSFRRCSCTECFNRDTGAFTAHPEHGSKPHTCDKHATPAPRAGKSGEPVDPVHRADKKTTNKTNSTTEDTEGTKGPCDVKTAGEHTGRKDGPEVQLPLSKRELLACVRVLTLGGHHESACAIYGPMATALLAGVEVLRVVETPHGAYETFHLCENVPGGSCPLVDAVRPRKLVVRNISGLPLPFPPLWEAAARTEEIVFVLPTTQAAYAGPAGDGPLGMLGSLMGQFNEASVLRVVLWDGWDRSLLSRSAREPAAHGHEAAHAPLYADDAAEILHAFTRTRRSRVWEMHRPRVEFYGLGAVRLAPRDRSPLVDAYREQHPGEKADLHQIVMRHVVRQEIGLAIPPDGGRPIVLGPCVDVKWFTLNNYRRKNFAAEISEWD